MRSSKQSDTKLSHNKSNRVFAKWKMEVRQGSFYSMPQEISEQNLLGKQRRSEATQKSLFPGRKREATKGR